MLGYFNVSPHLLHPAEFPKSSCDSLHALRAANPHGREQKRGVRPADKRSLLSIFQLRGKGAREDLVWLRAQETALLPELVKPGLATCFFPLHGDSPRDKRKD